MNNVEQDINKTSLRKIDLSVSACPNQNKKTLGWFSGVGTQLLLDLALVGLQELVASHHQVVGNIVVWLKSKFT